jgi:hypothetical protein
MGKTHGVVGADGVGDAFGADQRGAGARVWGWVTAAIGAVSGIAPHVLHHVGPIAGAALVGGALGSTLFGLLGLILSVPFLLRLKRRYGSWRAPAIALAIFAVVFTISTLVIGPAISGDGGTEATPAGHESHH